MCNTYYDLSVYIVHSVSWNIPSEKVPEKSLTLSVDMEETNQLLIISLMSKYSNFLSSSSTSRSTVSKSLGDQNIFQNDSKLSLWVKKCLSTNRCINYLSVINVYSVNWNIPPKKVPEILLTVSVDIEKQIAFPHW